ncbi:hypothetical protein ROZALSC1DRAFT_20401 [Rozella allomycis CSF55]|uniref:RBR-type E3 ubiquitin transferase n=1 Tax=Rozella allomycis (strain CSF55) TaxID=988480 RepID=A0A4P9YQM6_ROZAC|nr:hypothetical protein ROZALSC1DRAFT_20401 [Rozella allomycis CSF55]
MNMDYFVERCSICFDRMLDIQLSPCRDQFCSVCFNKYLFMYYLIRYVNEILDRSWGMVTREIKCPVCMISVHPTSWVFCLNANTMDKYIKVRDKKNFFVRYCDCCGSENYAIHQTVCKELLFDEFLKFLASDLELNKIFSSHVLLHRVELLDGMAEKLYEVFQEEYEILRLFKRSDSPYELRKLCLTRPKIDYNLLAEVSKYIVSFEYDRRVSMELQLKHVNQFPEINCKKCKNTLCLKCGFCSEHREIGCEECMKSLSRKRTIDYEKRQMIKWKINNTKACPNCHIYINRDEGCNQVDCVYCGYKFCWKCLSEWSRKCSFYRCGKGLIDGAEEEKSNLLNEKVELGVPDVSKISVFHSEE